jgi:glycerol uptake facilitator-like aquaporin
MAPFAASAFYVAAAYFEAGRYSGAIINPAAIVALHVYTHDLFDAATWRKAAPPAAPYLAGIAAAAVLLGVVKRATRPSRAGRSKTD